jgi:hypothetical protein
MSKSLGFIFLWVEIYIILSYFIFFVSFALPLSVMAKARGNNKIISDVYKKNSNRYIFHKSLNKWCFGSPPYSFSPILVIRRPSQLRAYYSTEISSSSSLNITIAASYDNLDSKAVRQRMFSENKGKSGVYR